MRGPEKNYKVELEPGDKPWRIVEKPTGLVIEDFSDCRPAKIMANFLNGGNGFNGSTPPFFLNKWVLTPLRG